ncbi:hypothetical protein D1610_14765 [Sphingomonas gilva]|uniref:O-antigen ligase-related domain-containing protein n=1 Tax=Sphingomonas gilva TaxID=2305907 RepID=A0A396RNA0_9SPHN|nr:O-antigen ligase family protein [Sphingomonas gilva]RHW16652.1 hypothetical protein D1610_14765 [Sphingomonas gilva]
MGLTADLLRSGWLWTTMIYLVACLVLGGSSAGGAIANALLQFGGLLIIVSALVLPRRSALPGEARIGLLLGLAAVAIALVQLVPLPWSIWTGFAGRGMIADSLTALGAGQPAMPISLSVDRTIASLLGFIPPLAMLSLGLRLDQPERRLALLVLIACVALSSIVGLLQITGAAQALYFYETTNYGRSVGFFANANHQATLLVMTLPLIAASIPPSDGSKPWWRPSNAVTLWLYAATALMALCAVATQSLAALGLVVVAGVGSAIILLTGRERVGGSRSSLIAGSLVLCVAMLGAGLYAMQQLAVNAEIGAMPGTRLDFYRNTLNAIGHFGLLGSGLGTFVDVYPAFQPATEFSRTYVNHAHNDILELVLETGLAGAILLLAAAWWFGRRSLDALRTTGGEGQLARGAALAIVVVLLHSMVDYPLRTSAIAGISGLLIALLCRPIVSAYRSADSGEA